MVTTTPLQLWFGKLFVYPTPQLSALEQISQRRSVKAMDLQGPGPSAEQLQTLLDAAARVPDHGKLGLGDFCVSRIKRANTLAINWHNALRL